MGTSSLNKNQRLIYRYYVQQGISVAKIARIKNTSKSAIYKTIKDLKKKGLIKGLNQGVEKIRCTPPATPRKTTFVSDGKNHLIRLHGMEFNIRILYKGGFYDRARRGGNFLVVDGHRVRLYRDSLEVYQMPGHGFVGDGVGVVNGLAADFWHRFFVRLEDRLRVVLLKDRYQNVRVVKHHYAEVGNELAGDLNGEGEVLRVFAREDGKLWLVVDASFGRDELETQHGETAGEDMRRVRRFFNDVRDNDPPTNSELAERIGGVVGLQEFYAENIKSHVGVVRSLGVGVEGLNVLLSRLVELVEGISVLQNNNINIVDRLLGDEELRNRFNMGSRNVKDEMLGLKDSESNGGMKND